MKYILFYLYIIYVLNYNLNNHFYWISTNRDYIIRGSFFMIINNTGSDFFYNSKTFKIEFINNEENTILVLKDEVKNQITCFKNSLDSNVGYCNGYYNFTMYKSGINNIFR